MKTLKQVKAYLEGRGIVQTDISYTDKVCTFGKSNDGEEIQIPDGCTVFPGFIDQHVHGAGGAEAIDATRSALNTISKTLVKSGTTSFLATTVTHSELITTKALRCIGDYIREKNKEGAEVLGAHMEGPFLTEKYKGGMRAEEMIVPSVETFDLFNNASGGAVKIVTLAPEASGATELIAHLSKKGIVASLGHTAATHEQVVNAVRAGAKSITHTYNAQSPLHHREIGVVGSALLMDELYCEMIADTVHVSVPAMQLLVKSKPKDKVILITDALSSQGLPEGISKTCGDLPVIIKDGCVRALNGTLMGTVVPMNGMIRNLVQKVGVPLLQAIDYATINPARNLSVEDRKGSIAIGKDADFAVLDDNFNVYMTIRGGKVVYKA